MSTFGNFVKAGLAASMIFVATPAFADYLPGDKSAEQQVPGFDMLVEYLSIEQFVPSRLEFRKLTADPVKDLVKIAKGQYKIALRVRAMQSLALYSDDQRAVETVDRLMTRVQPGSKLFGPTLVTWAAIHGETVVSAIAPYATHKSDDVRMAAVVALGRFCGQAGFEKLLELQQTEENEVVLGRINEMVN